MRSKSFHRKDGWRLESAALLVRKEAPCTNSFFLRKKRALHKLGNPTPLCCIRAFERPPRCGKIGVDAHAGERNIAPAILDQWPRIGAQPLDRLVERLRRAIVCTVLEEIAVVCLTHMGHSFRQAYRFSSFLSLSNGRVLITSSASNQPRLAWSTP